MTIYTSRTTQSTNIVKNSSDAVPEFKKTGWLQRIKDFFSMLFRLKNTNVVGGMTENNQPVRIPKAAYPLAQTIIYKTEEHQDKHGNDNNKPLLSIPFKINDTECELAETHNREIVFRSTVDLMEETVATDTDFAEVKERLLHDSELKETINPHGSDNTELVLKETQEETDIPVAIPAETEPPVLTPVRMAPPPPPPPLNNDKIDQAIKNRRMNNLEQLKQEIPSPTRKGDVKSGYADKPGQRQAIPNLAGALNHELNKLLEKKRSELDIPNEAEWVTQEAQDDMGIPSATPADTHHATPSSVRMTPPPPPPPPPISHAGHLKPAIPPRPRFAEAKAVNAQKIAQRQAALNPTDTMDDELKKATEKRRNALDKMSDAVDGQRKDQRPQIPPRPMALQPGKRVTGQEKSEVTDSSRTLTNKAAAPVDAGRAALEARLRAIRGAVADDDDDDDGDSDIE